MGYERLSLNGQRVKLTGLLQRKDGWIVITDQWNQSLFEINKAGAIRDLLGARPPSGAKPALRAFRDKVESGGSARSVAAQCADSSDSRRPCHPTTVWRPCSGHSPQFSRPSAW